MSVAEISPRIRILALAGLLAAVALGAGMMLLGRTQEDSSAATPLVPLKPPKTAAVAPTPAPAVRKPVRVKRAAKPVANPVSKPVAKVKPKAKPKPAVAPNGLPMAIASALERNEVVVVSLFAPDVAVDEIALKEARAGAQAAGAAFVALNVLEQSEGGPLTAKLGHLESPSVLVFHRPADVFVQLDGFSDRETIAQAASNAGT